MGRTEGYARTRLQPPWALLETSVRRTADAAREAGAAREASAAREMRLDTARVVSVQAPAGFGKTTWVLQWHRSRGIDPAWVSVAPPLHLIRVFWSSVYEVLRPRLPGDSEALAVRFETITEQPESAIIALCNALDTGGAGGPTGGNTDNDGTNGAAGAGPIHLVLDDVHTAGDAIVESLALFADNVPPHVRIWMISRGHTEKPFAQFALRGQYAAIGVDDLRLSDDESGEIIRSAHPGASPEMIAAIAARADGWPAGVQLLARAAAESGGDDPALPELTAATGALGPVLVDEILRNLDERDVSVILQTSILPIVDADAVAMVCERIDSSEAVSILRSLHRRGIFLARIPDAPDTFEYQPFFRDLLHAYRMNRPEEYREYTSRALGYLEERVDVDQALVIARETGRIDLLAGILSRNAETWFSSARYADYLLALDEVPGGERKRHDILHAQAIWARTILRQDCTEAELRADPAVSGEAQALVAAARAYSEFHNHGDSAACIDALAEAGDLSASGYPSAGAITGFIGIQARNWRGECDTALEMLSRTDRDSLYGFSPYLGVLHDINRGMILAHLARPVEARAFYEDAKRRLAARYGTSDFPFVGFLELHRLFLESFDADDDARRHLIADALLRIEDHGVDEMTFLAHMIAAVIVAPDDMSTAYHHFDRSLANTGQSRWGRRIALAEAVRCTVLFDDPEESRRWRFQMNSIASHGDLGSADPVLAESWFHLGQGDDSQALAELKRLEEYPYLSPIHDLEARLIRLRLTGGPDEVSALEARCDDSGLGRWARLRLGAITEPGTLRSGDEEGGAATHRSRSDRAPLTDGEIRALRDTQRSVEIDGFLETFQGREIQILHLMDRGASNAEIGEVIYVSVNTVRWYARQIFAKLDVRRRGEAVQAARTLGLLDGPD